MIERRGGIAAVALAALLAAGAAWAQARPPATAGTANGDELVQLDFDDAELADVIDTIAKLTQTNFIYDDRVRGRVTIVSPNAVTIDQAYAVFESVLQVKGFTTVVSPGGAVKVIPIREAKESTVETVQSSRPPPNRDRFVTRLIPLRYIDAESIVNTLKPLVSKDAAMAAYAPTNTVILTESSSNIRRMLAILEAIDIETYKEELAVLKVEFADATTLADQIAEIYGEQAETATTGATSRRSRRTRRTAPETTSAPERGRIRILTDERTNSLLVLAARQQLEEVRGLVRRLDVPVQGGGRIHVYYLRNANAEELAQTLNSLVTGQPAVRGGAQGAGGAQAQAIRAAVTELAEGVSITADPATNALVIQASLEGFQTIRQVIEKLDIQRPQVLVEALIMEVMIDDGEDLGFNGVVRLVGSDTQTDVGSNTGSGSISTEEMAQVGQFFTGAGAAPLVARFLFDGRDADGEGTIIEGLLRASASDNDTNILSAPHILTSDNEQAEIRIGNNIPIITSRVDSAAGQVNNLASSVNVERRDIGVTLRVTPQITEGNSLRLEIFQEITDVTDSQAGEVDEVGVTLINRRIENTVVVADGETIVIGGLISDNYDDNVSKVPFLGDIPVLGWAFKSTSKRLRKTNLLVFLTPHVVRNPADLESETIRKREEFLGKVEELAISEERVERERQSRAEARARGEQWQPPPTDNPIETALLSHSLDHPVSRLAEIEADRREAERLAEEAAKAAESGPDYVVQAAVYADETSAAEALTDFIDAGYDGTLISGEIGGVVMYQIHLGPYPDLDAAQEVGEIIRRTHGGTPTVLVVPPDRMEEE